jgi:hypothetical protein
VAAPVKVEGGASRRLRRKIDLMSPALAAASARLIEHPRVADLFVEHLITTHQIIRATVPLMEAALSTARPLADSDPVAAGVVGYLEEHAEEERDHDEWLLDDLEVLGVPREAVLARLPSATVASLVGAQYYWVLHYHPVAMLGYSALMEGAPPTLGLIDRLIGLTGHPREAFRTLAKHAELDQHHREELYDTIDSLPLSREQEMALGLSAMSSATLLERSLHEVVEGAGEAG